MTKQFQKGFTLVELAIVIVIIGLMIGGMLKGSNILSNSRVTATVAQVNAIEAAVRTFSNTYQALPGDMLNGHLRLPDCTPCSTTQAEDGIIGAGNWNLNSIQRNSPVTATNSGAGAETILFWAELAKAGLLTEINTDGITGGRPITFGGSHPEAPVGGGWVVGYRTTNAPVAATNGRLGAAGAYSMTGTILALLVSPTVPGASVSTSFDTKPLTPLLAAQLDRKLDDGLPNSGFVQAYGVTASCYYVPPPPPAIPTGTYRETEPLKNCGIYYRLHK